MDFGSQRLYTIELWDKNGNRIADISDMAFRRSYTIERNQAETLNFSLNVYKFETYCATIGVDPQVILRPWSTDVKVKRGSTYLFGAVVVDASVDLAQDFSRANETGGGAAPTTSDYNINISCMGYLNFFKYRYISKTYTPATERTTIATDMITTTQAQTNGSFGVTIASGQYTTGVTSVRTYQRDEIKLKLQELAALTDAPFDFGFTYDKQFQTYSQIGTRRSDISLVYGGDTSNVAGFSLSRNGLSMVNHITGLGSGFGIDQLTSIQDDTISQLDTYLLEDISQYSSVTESATLANNVAADLSLHKAILELPVATITGLQVPFNNFLHIGDRIPLVVKAHTYLASINKLYRIEKMDVTIDENDFESQIKLTFDSYGVNQNE
jgi:hypothetical protein